MMVLMNFSGKSGKYLQSAPSNSALNTFYSLESEAILSFDILLDLRARSVDLCSTKQTFATQQRLVAFRLPANKISPRQMKRHLKKSGISKTIN